MAELMKVEVAYASRDRAEIMVLRVPVGTTIREAIDLSGVLLKFPEIDLSQQAVGVFSKKRDLSDKLVAGERVEIYRRLTIDPMEARRAKAKMKAKRGN